MSLLEECVCSGSDPICGGDAMSHREHLGKGPKIKKRESMVFGHRGGEGGVSPKTKSLFRITISFKLLVCTGIHPMCGEMIDLGS